MNTLRAFQPHGDTIVSIAATGVAIDNTPMGTSVLRITNIGETHIKVALGDTAAEAVANLATQYITIIAGTWEYLQVKNTQRYVASDTADIPMIMGTGGY